MRKELIELKLKAELDWICRVIREKLHMQHMVPKRVWRGANTVSLCYLWVTGSKTPPYRQQNGIIFAYNVCTVTHTL